MKPAEKIPKKMSGISEPWIKTISLSPPSLQDNTADADRIINALKKELHTDAIHTEFSLLKQLPDILRKWNYHVRCILVPSRGQWLLTGIAHAEDRKPFMGLAVDLGTTRVVLRLADISTGRILGESAFDNPQISVGPDILARIHYADTEEGLATVNRLIIDGLNREIVALCGKIRIPGPLQKADAEKGISPQDIYLISVAGNTAMTHLFMGLNPRWIIREPYIPVVNKPGVVKAEELGIKAANPLCRILVFPNVGSYFGGDLIAGILFSGMNTAEDTAILVDVGTNAEVVLGNKNWLIACAGAAGPALEGGVTKMGMMAGPGVIDKIAIDPDTHEFDIRTIGNMPPKGICGSGLIDLAAHLFLSGMLDIRGRLLPSVCGHRLKEKDNIRYLTVVPENNSAAGEELIISQTDIDSLIRSKAAMYTILETITASVGMSLSELSRFYVAGTFGSFISPRSAISIGMIPDLPPDCYKPLGNSSLGGATLALTSPECIAEIDRIRERITYLELNVNQDFMNRFSAAKFLPHTNPSLFPSVKIRAEN
ncbi:ASKHA domain-containing protein [Desulfococcaceae bacterium HSG8]|nr:ASKHA domain-containing protein [Desulfococcaceae bacterium HSG8]